MNRTLGLVQGLVRRRARRNVGFATSIIVASLLCISVATSIGAAPITFRLEAVVASVFPTDGGANLPFAVSLGDSISTTLTFEPGSPGPIYPQTSTMSIDIAGHTLETTDFLIRVAHDELIGIDVPGRIVNPNSGPDVDGGSNGDSLYVTCAYGGPPFCGVAKGDPNLIFVPTIVFSEPAFVLSSNDLLGDVAVWRAFSRREMSLLFKDVATARTSYVGAYIGNIEQVPEPSALQHIGPLTILPIFIAIVGFRRNRGTLSCLKTSCRSAYAPYIQAT